MATNDQPVHINPEKLRRLIARIYQAQGLAERDAACLADTLVLADMWGHSSHGVMRTFWYADRMTSGAINLAATRETLLDTGPLLHIDGQNGIGQVITQQATDLVRDRAKQFGIAAIAIRNSGHFGTAMYFTRQLAEAGCVGFLATNASPAMPPTGGTEKLIGNNPQSWAAPSGMDAPFVLDIAHTAVARGKIFLAREKGEPIPIGWAMDADGRPTDDPVRAIEGSLLPAAGHKGFGLSAMMDVLSGILPAGGFGTGVTGPYVTERPSRAGHFIMAVDIAKLRPIAEFKADMKSMITGWHTSAKAPASDGIYYPGEMEHAAEQHARQSGIELPDKVAGDLLMRAGQIGIDVKMDDIAMS